MWGEEKEKSQFSQPHWWLPYGVFQGKAPLNPSTQTTVNILLLPWHNYASVWSILTSALTTCLIIGLYIVLRWAGWSGLSDQWSNHTGKGADVLRDVFEGHSVVCLRLICYQQHSRIDHKKPHLNQIFLFMCLSSEFKFLFVSIYAQHWDLWLTKHFLIFHGLSSVGIGDQGNGDKMVH